MLLLVVVWYGVLLLPGRRSSVGWLVGGSAPRAMAVAVALACCSPVVVAHRRIVGVCAGSAGVRMGSVAARAGPDGVRAGSPVGDRQVPGRRGAGGRRTGASGWPRRRQQAGAADRAFGTAWVPDDARAAARAPLEWTSACQYPSLPVTVLLAATISQHSCAVSTGQAGARHDQSREVRAIPGATVCAVSAGGGTWLDGRRRCDREGRYHVAPMPAGAQVHVRVRAVVLPVPPTGTCCSPNRDMAREQGYGDAIG